MHSQRIAARLVPCPELVVLDALDADDPRIVCERCTCTRFTFARAVAEKVLDLPPHVLRLVPSGAAFRAPVRGRRHLEAQVKFVRLAAGAKKCSEPERESVSAAFGAREHGGSEARAGLGRLQRGETTDAPFNKLTGRGYVSPKAADYACALVAGLKVWVLRARVLGFDRGLRRLSLFVWRRAAVAWELASELGTWGARSVESCAAN